AGGCSPGEGGGGGRGPPPRRFLPDVALQHREPTDPAPFATPPRGAADRQRAVLPTDGDSGAQRSRLHFAGLRRSPWRVCHQRILRPPTFSGSVTDRSGAPPGPERGPAVRDRGSRG